MGNPPGEEKLGGGGFIIERVLIDEVPYVDKVPAMI